MSLSHAGRLKTVEEGEHECHDNEENDKDSDKFLIHMRLRARVPGLLRLEVYLKKGDEDRENDRSVDEACNPKKS